MKLALITIFGLLIGQSAFAGDAGYFSRTCLSSTQRTVLTVLNDYTQSAPIYTLVVDGVPAIFNLADRSVREAGDDGVLVISKNGVDAFRTEYNSTNGKMTLTIYVDPRVGTIAQNNATPTPIRVQVQCKDFWPNP